jgi:putative transposase
MRSSYKVGQEGLYFITSTIVEWIPVFTSEKYFKIITNSLTHCRVHKQLKIFVYVIMDNHLHMIVYSDNLSSIMKDFKRHTAKEILSL